MLDEGLPVKAIILASQISGYIWNTVVNEISELIKEIIAIGNVDSERISLTGLSMGGYGTW